MSNVNNTSNNFEENSIQDENDFEPFNTMGEPYESVWWDMFRWVCYLVSLIAIVLVTFFKMSEAKASTVYLDLDMMCISQQAFINGVQNNPSSHIVGKKKIAIVNKKDGTDSYFPMFRVLNSDSNLIFNWIVNSEVACIMYVEENNNVSN